MHQLRKPHWQILIALALAVLAGIFLKNLPAGSSSRDFLLSGCSMLGEMFLRALKMMITPIVLVSIICGIGGAGAVKGFGRLGLKTCSFYAATTLIAAATGLGIVNLMEPGLEDGRPNAVVRAAIQNEAAKLSESGAADRVLEKVGQDQGSVWQTLRLLLTRMIPENIAASAAATDMLGLITFAMLVGAALAFSEGPGVDTLRRVFHGLNEVVLRVTGWVMALAPVGVFALVTPVVAATGGEIFGALARYFVTVLLGLALHLFVTMPFVLLVLGRMNPKRHFQATRDALLTAFSTASSNATLPVSLRCVQENAGVSQRVAGFTLPLGATVNMNGTALYECVAVLFVAQVLGQELGTAAQLTVVILALLTSVGVAGVPSASLVAIVIILQGVGIEGAGAAIAVLFSVDRLLDMSRTAVNVFGDTCAAVVIARSEGEAVLMPPDPAK